MKKAAPADLQRWSEEFARDPGSLAFLPLARAYRRQGRSDAALRLCLRGLERHPDNIDAHGLLALLYVERGERERAADEWSVVLRLDPGNFDAQRGLGFCHLDAGDAATARRYLEHAALVRPDDASVREALRLAQERSAPPPAAVGGDFTDEPWMQTPSPVGWVEPGRNGTAAPSLDPDDLFAEVVTGGIVGALLLDAQGLVLAGGLGNGSGEALAALLGDAIAEAARTTRLLALGEWSGLQLETPEALLHIAPTGDALLVIAAEPDAPAGWLKRSALQAADLATRFLEASR